MMLLLLFPRCCLFTGHVRVTVVTRHGVVSRLGRHGVCGPRAVWRSGVAVLILQMKFCVLLLKKKRHFFFSALKKLHVTLVLHDSSAELLSSKKFNQSIS